MLGLIFTVLAYEVSCHTQKRWRSQILNPIITATGVLVAPLLFSVLRIEHPVANAAFTQAVGEAITCEA